MPGPGGAARVPANPPRAVAILVRATRHYRAMSELATEATSRCTIETSGPSTSSATRGPTPHRRRPTDKPGSARTRHCREDARGRASGFHHARQRPGRSRPQQLSKDFHLAVMDGTRLAAAWNIAWLEQAASIVVPMHLGEQISPFRPIDHRRGLTLTAMDDPSNGLDAVAGRASPARVDVALGGAIPRAGSLDAPGLTRYASIHQLLAQAQDIVYPCQAYASVASAQDRPAFAAAFNDLACRWDQRRRQFLYSLAERP